MIRIAVGNNIFATVDDCDWDLAFYSWHLTFKTYGYVQASVLGKNIRMHILIAERMGLLQADRVDHIDRNPLNNIRTNLREATHLQNNINRSFQNKNGLTGVTLNGKKYRARIRMNGIQIHLGTYDTPEEAHEAYIRACKSLYGEYAP